MEFSAHPKTSRHVGTNIPRRQFLRSVLALGITPCIIPSSALGADGHTAPSNRIVLACIGVGSRGLTNAGSIMDYSEAQLVAVCDVQKSKGETAKTMVDRHYRNSDCKAYNDFRDITMRPDIDAVIISTPDHWHALMSVDAMRHGKDVFCEKPESLTVREGRAVVEATRRYSRVFSGGSQRVWEEYKWFHQMVRGGEIGDVIEGYVDTSGPSTPCTLPGEPVPEGLDWELWLGPAPWAPYHATRLDFRPWRDYSGGGMTDWGAHGFGGLLFCLQLHETGPATITPPNGKEVKHLTYEFANHQRIIHRPGKAGQITIRGTRRAITKQQEPRITPPSVVIPNYKGNGIQGDFLHCVKTRQRPFRDVEVAHRTMTVCHLGNIAYWLNRPIKWDPIQEEIIGDAEASRWLSRPLRSPWHLA